MFTLPPAVVQTVLLIGILYLANAYIVKPMLLVADSMKVEIETLKQLKANNEQTYLQEIHEIQRELQQLKDTLKQQEEILESVRGNTKNTKKKSDLIWDKASNKVMITKDRKVATKISGGSVWNAGVQATQAVTNFTVRILDTKQSAMMVGFAPETFSTGGYNHATRGWFISTENGNLYSNGIMNQSYANQSIMPNTIITVKLKEDKCIYFEIGGEQYPAAFCNVPDVPLFASVDFGEVSQSIELL